MSFNKRPRDNEDPLPSSLPSAHLESTQINEQDLLTQPHSEEEEELVRDPLSDIEEDSNSEGEDLFGDQFEKDYKPNTRLDRYDINDLDDELYSDMSLDQRRQVDQLLERREQLRLKQEGRLGAFLGDEEEVQFRSRRRRQKAGQPDDDLFDPNALDPEFMLDDLKGRSVAEWVSMDQPRKHIALRFKRFLEEFSCPNGSLKYIERIQQMCEINGKSLDVSYADLNQQQTILALWLADAPEEMLTVMNEVATQLVREKFERYGRVTEEIHCRVTELPAMETIRDLRHFHTNKLIRVSGVVTKRSAMLPQIKYVTFGCSKCNHVMGPFYQMGHEPPKLSKCAACESRGPFYIKNEQTQYRDYQKITLQESPGSVPPGRLPRSKEVILLWDLVDSVRPGDQIEVTGIYKNVLDIALNASNGFPLFATVIEANSIMKQEDQFATYKLTQEDKNEILRLSQDPRISQRIFKSIAPSIYGHEMIKMAIALSLFGGVAKDIQGKHRLRGDLNILMMGDPGTAKSQFLKYVEKTANRAVFTTGQGASAVGLTASVHKSPVTREWTLEGGALVLADKGVCLIDEFDKMNEQDRTSIHEAMEQQSISVSKAGIVCTLQARCAVIAAANPKTGRYQSYRSFQENVDLTEPILSRFDVLCVVKDQVDLDVDQQLARFVVDNHERSHPDFQYFNRKEQEKTDGDLISQSLLKKYIMYAKETVRPRLNHLDQDKLAKVYSTLRRESLACGSIPMTVRHVESMIRMAEAHAKMHLRDFVRQQDLDVAIHLMLESFLQANKQSVYKQLRRKFERFILGGGDESSLLQYLLKQLTQEYLKYFLSTASSSSTQKRVSEVWFKAEEFEVKAKEMGVFDMEGFYGSEFFIGGGYSIETRVFDGRSQRVIIKRV